MKKDAQSSCLLNIIEHSFFCFGAIYTFVCKKSVNKKRMRILKSEWSFMVNHSIQLCMTIWSYMRYHKLMTDLFCTWTSMCASNGKKKHDPYCRKHHISDALRFCKRNVIMWACSFCSLPHTWHTRVTGEGTDRQTVRSHSFTFS